MPRTDGTGPRADVDEIDLARSGLVPWAGRPGLPETFAALRADLALVDALEDRLDELTYPDPRGGEHTAADVVRALFREARHDFVRWHATPPEARRR